MENLGESWCLGVFVVKIKRNREEETGWLSARYCTRICCAIPLRCGEEDGLAFAKAKKAADREAAKKSGDPMLLAWYEGSTGRFSPQVTCCGEDKPAWLIYAESRGGNIVVDINDEAYVFVYRA